MARSERAFAVRRQDAPWVRLDLGLESYDIDIVLVREGKKAEQVENEPCGACGVSFDRGAKNEERTAPNAH